MCTDPAKALPAGRNEEVRGPCRTMALAQRMQAALMYSGRMRLKGA